MNMYPKKGSNHHVKNTCNEYVPHPQHTHLLLQHELSNTYLHLCYWFTLLFITYYGLMCRSLLEAVGRHEATCLYLHQFTTCGFLISPVWLSVFSLSLFVSLHQRKHIWYITNVHAHHPWVGQYIPVQKSDSVLHAAVSQANCYSNKYTGSTWGQNQKINIFWTHL